eukprot:2808837-Pleurochrysis_carterae.AAC.1
MKRMTGQCLFVEMTTASWLRARLRILKGCARSGRLLRAMRALAHVRRPPPALLAWHDEI